MRGLKPVSVTMFGTFSLRAKNSKHVSEYQEQNDYMSNLRFDHGAETFCASRTVLSGVVLYNIICVSWDDSLRISNPINV